MSGAYTTGQLLNYVSSVIANDAGPGPDGTTIYVLYLPPTASLADFDFGTCGGYHTPFPLVGNSTGDELAVIEPCPPLHYETPLGNETNTASHEIIEAATDSLDQGYNLGETPSPPWSATVWQSWALAGHVELADLCEGTWYFEAADGGPDGGWEYQRVWSNAGAASGGDPCIPPTGTPYYSMNTSKDWYELPADGGTVTIPLTPWSTAPTSEWLLSTHLDSSYAMGTLGPMITNGGVTITSSLGVGNPECSGGLREGVDDCEGATLQVAAPSGALSGDWAVISLHSFREDSTCWQPTSSDLWHFIPIGVYVP